MSAEGEKEKLVGERGIGGERGEVGGGEREWREEEVLRSGRERRALRFAAGRRVVAEAIAGE